MVFGVQGYPMAMVQNRGSGVTLFCSFHPDSCKRWSNLVLQMDSLTTMQLEKHQFINGVISPKVYNPSYPVYNAIYKEVNHSNYKSARLETPTTCMLQNGFQNLILYEKWCLSKLSRDNWVYP